MLTSNKNDLGNANRNHIFTVDPGHRGVNHRRVIAIRECNDETTDAGKNAAANKKATAGWSSKLSIFFVLVNF